MSNLNLFEKIVGNEAFAHHEQMLHFQQCFQRSSVTEAYLWSKGLRKSLIHVSHGTS